MIYHVETKCRSCGSAQLETIIEFGETPLADRLLTAQQLDDPEYRVPLSLAFCKECGLAQILETVNPEILFYAEYPYFSSVSPSLLRQIEAAEDVLVELGFEQFRVRHHDKIARIEVPVHDFPAMLKHHDQIVEGIKAAGYQFVTLDLAGFRSGSLNGAETNNIILLSELLS